MNVCQGFAKHHLVCAFCVGGILVYQFVVVDFGLCLGLKFLMMRF
jgi:hypothetical protein